MGYSLAMPENGTQQTTIFSLNSSASESPQSVHASSAPSPLTSWHLSPKGRIQDSALASPTLKQHLFVSTVKCYWVAS